MEEILQTQELSTDSIDRFHPQSKLPGSYRWCVPETSSESLPSSHSDYTSQSPSQTEIPTSTYIRNEAVTKEATNCAPK